MNKKYRVGIYCRLSREDGDNMESESIKNQKDFIRSYLSKLEDIDIIFEYIDDGYTGGNFNRPSWNRLIKDIEEKKIDTVVTKDLSRMGRDYIKMGEYIERIFPEKNIRYIAINDDIDTLYETPGLDYLQFKLLFNDFYIKDGSKKIRKILRSKKEEGKYTGWKGIYGYKRNPLDKHKLVIDEQVKDNVVRMFNLAKQGYSPKYIADLFSQEGIPNPSMYANVERKSRTSSLWCERTVKDLLENETYIGNLTQGIRKKVSYKSKKEVRVPKEEWIIVKNTHEKLIDEDIFKTVQLLLKKNKNNPLNKDCSLLKGFLFCKECGHRIGINLSSDKKRKYCVCNYYQSHSKFKVCTPHSLNYEKLEDLVLKELKKLFETYIDKERIEIKITELWNKNNSKEEKDKEINYLNIRIKELNNYMDKTYIDRLENKIGFEQYERVTAKLKEELEKVKSKKASIKNYYRLEVDNSSDKTFVNEFLSLNKPSRELLVNLIDKITIDENKNIEVFYKFKLL